MRIELELDDVVVEELESAAKRFKLRGIQEYLSLCLTDYAAIEQLHRQHLRKAKYRRFVEVLRGTVSLSINTQDEKLRQDAQQVIDMVHGLIGFDIIRQDLALYGRCYVAHGGFTVMYRLDPRHVTEIRRNMQDYEYWYRVPYPDETEIEVYECDDLAMGFLEHRDLAKSLSEFLDRLLGQCREQDENLQGVFGVTIEQQPTAPEPPARNCPGSIPD